MKKALLLGLLGWLLAAVPALAYPPLPANVNFTSERGVPFGVVLDGRPLTRGLTRQVHVDRLLPGQHWADFTVPTAYGGTMRFRSRVWLQPGLETTFVLVTRPGQPLYLQQASSVALYAPGYGPGYYNNGGGRYNSPAPYGPGSSYGAPGGYPAPAPQGGYDYDEADETDGYGTAPMPNGSYPNSGPYGNNPNVPNGGPYGNNPNYPGAGGYNNGPSPAPASNYRRLTTQDVDALVRTVQARIADASKLSAAKDGLADRSLRTDDLLRLLRTTSSEACRVDLATFAYSHVSDPENFYRVYDVFTSESAARAVATAVHDDNYRR